MIRVLRKTGHGSILILPGNGPMTEVVRLNHREVFSQSASPGPGFRRCDVRVHAFLRISINSI